ncbi:hypothetical protein [Nocardia puris]|uniref:hypothetical protein n=1 Tax=Nocardia puris TaxID=208602 RepID=UPI002E20FDAD
MTTLGEIPTPQANLLVVVYRAAAWQARHLTGRRSVWDVDDGAALQQWARRTTELAAQRDIAEAQARAVGTPAPWIAAAIQGGAARSAFDDTTPLPDAVAPQREVLVAQVQVEMDQCRHMVSVSQVFARHPGGPAHSPIVARRAARAAELSWTRVALLAHALDLSPRERRSLWGRSANTLWRNAFAAQLSSPEPLLARWRELTAPTAVHHRAIAVSYLSAAELTVEDARAAGHTPPELPVLAQHLTLRAEAGPAISTAVTAAADPTHTPVWTDTATTPTPPDPGPPARHPEVTT